MTSSPLARFLSSMIMDYEKWHDGIGYDLDALDEMPPSDLAAIEQKLISKLDDWRDLEALAHIGSPKALEAIVKTRHSSDRELRLAAQTYGPDPEPDVREAAILEGLKDDDVYGGLSKALDQAAEHPSPKVVQALLRCARDRGEVAAYGAAAVLYFIKGKIESHEGFENRPFFLRFVDPDTDDHKAAFLQLCDELGYDPQEAK